MFEGSKESTLLNIKFMDGPSRHHHLLKKWPGVNGKLRKCCSMPFRANLELDILLYTCLLTFLEDYSSIIITET